MGFWCEKRWFSREENQNFELLSGATREASSWGAGGELPRPALMYFVVLGIWGRSAPFQTDSFDVIKCN